jgi:two-component system, sensor histidine kinase and response regulator
MDNTKSPKTGTVLLVDDNLDHLQILERLLSSKGHISYKISSAPQAIPFAKKVQPDLIFLDITMPEINGFEICRQLKANKKTRHIPVVFMSAIHNTVNQRKAISVGAEDYITKPIDIDKVIVLVDTFIKQPESITSP